ncbi:MAG: hypothetical protein ACXVFQ_07090, partial [Solirubrobacteraceae bacterium]
KTITVAAGGFLAAPPLVAHSFRTDGDRPARWLTIHAHDGGFAAFMRGLRDGTKIQWDISAVPADGGLSASYAIVSPNLADEHRETESQPRRLRCALPDLCVADWHLRGRQPLDLRLRDQGSQIDTFLILDGAVAATLAGATQTVGPGAAHLGPPRPATHASPTRAGTCTNPEPPHTKQWVLIRPRASSLDRQAVCRPLRRQTPAPGPEALPLAPPRHSRSTANPTEQV